MAGGKILSSTPYWWNSTKRSDIKQCQTTAGSFRYDSLSNSLNHWLVLQSLILVKENLYPVLFNKEWWRVLQCELPPRNYGCLKKTYPPRPLWQLMLYHLPTSTTENIDSILLHLVALKEKRVRSENLFWTFCFPVFGVVAFGSCSESVHASDSCKN